MDAQHIKARELRNNMTKQERKLWSVLRNRKFYDYRFLRQYPIGNYIVDFICRSAKIIIEIDCSRQSVFERRKMKKVNLYTITSTIGFIIRTNFMINAFESYFDNNLMAIIANNTIGEFIL